MDEREHLYSFQEYSDDVINQSDIHIAGATAITSYDNYTPSIHFSVGIQGG